MPKFAILFAGLLALAACNGTGNFDAANNETLGSQVAQPTDGIATDP